MIRIKYEEYYNDYKRNDYEKTFKNLSEVEEWIFGQMKLNYSNKENSFAIMYFPKKGISSIEFHPSHTSPDYWIHQMENADGIIFSDGKYTSGQKHMNKQVKEWCEHCRERQFTPKFNFVE